MPTVQAWMGHRDIETTQIYADYMPDAAKEAGEQNGSGAPAETQAGEGETEPAQAAQHEIGTVGRHARCRRRGAGAAASVSLDLRSGRQRPRRAPAVGGYVKRA